MHDENFISSLNHNKHLIPIFSRRILIYYFNLAQFAQLYN